jgi:hypothetical protein
VEHSAVPFPRDVYPVTRFRRFLRFVAALSIALFVRARAIRYFPLGDEECAGARMLVWVTFAYLAPALVVTIQLLSRQRHALTAEVA